MGSVARRASNSLPGVVFVLGAPGSGKGTQCANLVRDYGFVHLSAGDLLREERRRPGSTYATMIEEKIRNGEIVPVEVTCALLDTAMKNANSDRFLVDGFPRNEDNLKGWERTMSDKVRLLLVLQLECDQNQCIERCLARGAQGSGRSDDNEQSLIKRFVTYTNDTLPIVNHYETLDLVQRVDAKGSPDQVYDSVKAAMKSAGIDAVRNNH